MPRNARIVSQNHREVLMAEPHPDGLVEGVARAIYMAHRRPPAPIWENASDNVQQWVRKQARAALEYLRTRTGGDR